MISCEGQSLNAAVHHQIANGLDGVECVHSKRNAGFTAAGFSSRAKRKRLTRPLNDCDKFAAVYRFCWIHLDNNMFSGVADMRPSDGLLSITRQCMLQEKSIDRVRDVIIRSCCIQICAKLSFNCQAETTKPFPIGSLRIISTT